MKSARRGKSTLGAEVTNVSIHGIWILVDERERFLPFDRFPWFRDATIAEITRIERPSFEHIFWPSLDVDLSLASIDRPEEFPLVSKVKNRKRSKSSRS